MDANSASLVTVPYRKTILMLVNWLFFLSSLEEHICIISQSPYAINFKKKTTFSLYLLCHMDLALQSDATQGNCLVSDNFHYMRLFVIAEDYIL